MFTTCEYIWIDGAHPTPQLRSKMRFVEVPAGSGIYVDDGSTLRRVAGWLHLMLRALRVDGCKGRGPGLGGSTRSQ